VKPPVRIALSAVFALALIALAPVATAAPSGGGHGGGGGGGGIKGSCTTNAPAVSVQNTWAWGQTGSYGLPGQQLTYLIQVITYDGGCSASTFNVAISAPSGFSVSIPTSTISLKSPTQTSLLAYITSPSGAADGDYPLSVTAQRSGTSNTTASSTSYYKVYSS